MKRQTLFYALKEISFTLNDQSICGLIGLNGAGKTTLLRLLTGISECTSGIIQFDDYTISEFNHHRPFKIAYLSNDTQVYHRLTTMEYLQFFAKIKKLPRHLFQSRLEEYSYKLKIENELNTVLEFTSTGTRQKVAFLSVIISHPDYLFLDEPFSNIDILVAEEMLNILRNLKELGTSMIISSHNLYEIESVADSILLLNEGNLLINSGLNDLYQQYPEMDLKEIIINFMTQHNMIRSNDVSCDLADLL